MVKMSNGIGSVMMVFTGESPAQIIASGTVTTPLPFNLMRAENTKYVVCCQNAMIEGATELHNSAFLIGIVTDCNSAEINGRLMGVSLKISHYVLVSQPDKWYAKRNVSHFFFNSLKDAKMRLGRYDFTPIEKEMKRLMIVTAKRPAPAMATRMTTRVATGKGLVKRDKFPVANVPETEVEIVEPTEQKVSRIIAESDIRYTLAKLLGVKPAQVSVTVSVTL